MDGSARNLHTPKGLWHWRVDVGPQPEKPIPYDRRRAHYRPDRNKRGPAGHCLRHLHGHRDDRSGGTRGPVLCPRQSLPSAARPSGEVDGSEQRRHPRSSLPRVRCQVSRRRDQRLLSVGSQVQPEPTAVSLCGRPCSVHWQGVENASTDLRPRSTPFHPTKQLPRGPDAADLVRAIPHQRRDARSVEDWREGIPREYATLMNRQIHKREKCPQPLFPAEDLILPVASRSWTCRRSDDCEFRPAPEGASFASSAVMTAFLSERGGLVTAAVVGTGRSPAATEVRGGFPPTADHGLISDLQTAALIAKGDWYCCPRFDSPSVFASLLDHTPGRHFQLRGRKQCQHMR